MKHTMTYAKHLAVAALLAQLPTVLRADCMPSGATGDLVPFTMVTLKNNQVASYATGTLQLSNSGAPYSLDHSTTVSGTQIPQLFSNRTATNSACAGEKICLLPPQPFNINQADNLGVSITEATTWNLTVPPYGPVTAITVTLTLESWGNAQTSFTGTCNAAGELYGSYDSNTTAVFAFGTPYAAPPPPPPPK
jgi:hypothetical protein